MIRRIYDKARSVISADSEVLYEKDRAFLSQPFYFPGTNGKAVLLIHGWTDVPYEVRRLGLYLNEKGYAVSGPILRGHGTAPEDLKEVKWEDWLGDVKRAYQELRENHQQVYIVGTSIGSNLAVMLAAHESEISGLVLMAMPYAIRQERLVLLLVRIANLFISYARKYYPATFGKGESITRRISYQTYPLKSVLEVFELVKRARQELGKIVQPCLIMQSTSDHIVAKNSLEKIFSSVSSKVKRQKYIHGAYHTFISDIENEHVFEDILNFLEKN